MVTQSAGLLENPCQTPHVRPPKRIAPSLPWLLGALVVAFFVHYEKKKKKKMKALQNHWLEVKEKKIKALQSHLLEVKAKEEIAQQENQKASSLIKDLQKQLKQKENESASLVKTNEEIAQRENEKALSIKFLKSRLEQKEDEHYAVVKAKYEKALLVTDLQMQIEKKENENASLIKANEEIAQKDTEKALLIRDLQKQLALSEKEYAQKATEHASLVRDFEQQLAQQVNHELAQRIQSQPQVDGETWQFQGDSSKWVSFPDYANKALMVRFGEGYATCEIVIDGKIYEIDFTKSSQMNQNTKKERKIRCFFDLPSHWQMTNDDALKFLKESLQAPPTILQPLLPVTDQDVKSRLGDLLNRSLSRHDGNQCNCLHGSSKFVVTEAFQVENLNLWRRYQRFVRSIQDKHKQHGISLEEINPSVSEALTDFAKQINVDLAGNERLLLHGTRNLERATAIATEGFDNRIARDGLFGKGTYFAAQTCKSAQYATPDGKRSKASLQLVGTMLIARVAIGDPYYTPGACADLSRPPEKNGVRADSVIAKPSIPNGQYIGVQSHMEVVTFDPGQAYPEFIIQFTEE